MARVQPNAAKAPAQAPAAPVAPAPAADASNPAAPPTANPGATEGGAEATATAVEKKKSRGDLIVHPALKPDADGKPTVKLDKFPTDYVTTKHKLLTAAHFTSEKAFLIAKAEKLEEQAKELRQQAESATKFGPNAAVFAKQLKRFDEVKAQLERDGVDVAALIESLRAKKEADAATEKKEEPKA
jgi:hypothetical protein